ncbi:MAG: hypothetical protein ACR2QK_11785, partial [Acidimicrobiales bacterium]
SGETLSASGGRVGRAFVAVTPGIHHESLSPEVVAGQIDRILDENDYLVPTSVDQEIELLMAHLGDRAGDDASA